MLGAQLRKGSRGWNIAHGIVFLQLRKILQLHESEMGKKERRGKGSRVAEGYGRFWHMTERIPTRQKPQINAIHL